MTYIEGRAWSIRANLPVSQNGSTTGVRDYPFFLRIPEKTWIKVQATSKSNTTEVSTSFDFILKNIKAV